MTADLPGLKIIGTAPNKGALMTFSIEGVHPLDLATLLDLKQISIRSGHLCAQTALRRFGLSAAARISFGVYNTLEEVERFSNALRSVVSSLAR
jgi:cysteine desulfurase/selenocysteine lyase